MIADRAKRRAAGRVKWAINKLLAHADMAVKVPEAALSQVLPSAQQCCRLADGLGAALVELESALDVAKTAFHAAPDWPSLRWTAEKPKRRGWWWVLDKDYEGPCVRRVDKLRAFGWRLCVYSGLDGWVPVDEAPADVRWAGPLPEPESASDAPTTANQGRLTACGQTADSITRADE